MTKRNIVYPYIPNTAPETKAVLMEKVKAKTEMELFDSIPAHLLQKEMNLPEPLLDEYSIRRHADNLLSQNANLSTHKYFLGAGCAPHYVPAVVDEIIGRGELATAYSGLMADQGKSQIQFEYQSMMAELLDMGCMAMPQYDGGTSAGHAIRIACRITERRKVLMPKSMSPQNGEIIQNYLGGIEQSFADIEYIAFDKQTGLLDLDDLQSKLDDQTAAVFIENPTFLGVVETQAEQIGKLAKQAGAEFIVYADPISLGVIEAPGTYGATIACGDIHSLGNHMSAGGGVAGYVMVKDEEAYLYQLKDQMVGASPTSVDGEIGFSWVTAFERTSYAVREDALEFTGTNAALLSMAAGVYLALMGPQGMASIGESIMQKSQYAAKQLAEIPGVSIQFTAPFFKEFVVDFNRTNKTVAEINQGLLQHKIFGGYDLSQSFPELGQSALFCVTEIHTQSDIDELVETLKAMVE
ncbi:glycine dehydrogenase [Photobacterium jeanii]|uniref:Glycine dehydrogenase n=1 Tax=Photobacterium jeanii TaxID=858640 RepID=A0A178KQ40_9GAMM|nr:aminomethyl-transferring glycine dehydrogenase subunit GcvPA [Photobacterium jeanii]OAN18783.1 glycine dehydrogenase [Photobacterium jeanii]PST92811.1 aminomethyl-transferring glycine dehydrogenase subunit GcvPA [Photobacterium jeanii]